MPVASKGDADSRPRALGARPPPTSLRKIQPSFCSTSDRAGAETRVAPVSRVAPPAAFGCRARRARCRPPRRRPVALRAPRFASPLPLLPYARERDGELPAVGTSTSASTFSCVRSRGGRVVVPCGRNSSRTYVAVLPCLSVRRRRVSGSPVLCDVPDLTRRAPRVSRPLGSRPWSLWRTSRACRSTSAVKILLLLLCGVRSLCLPYLGESFETDLHETRG